VNALRAIAAEPGPLFIVGSCKNAGKTTLLNFLNAELHRPPATTVGLATIGRDGEAEDAVWRHPKPPVALRPGNLFVTVEPELAKLGGDAERLETLPFRTVLGEVALGRARRDAHVEIDGPDTNGQLWQAIERLRAHGATLQLIDGAFERRTQAAERDGARVALAISADVAPSPAEAAAWLALQCEMFGLPKKSPPLAVPADAPLGLHGLADASSAVACVGPLTDAMVLPDLDAFAGRELFVDDATKIFLSATAWRAVTRRCRGVFVRRALRLLLAAANPCGLLRQFSPGDFFAALAAACPVLPLIDVHAGLYRDPKRSIADFRRDGAL
jgi:hypothetical protein